MTRTPRTSVEPAVGARPSRHPSPPTPAPQRRRSTALAATLIAAAALPAQRTARLTDIDGARFEAVVVGVDGDALRLADQPPRALGALESLRFADASGGLEPRPGRVWLRSGTDHAAAIGTADGGFALDLGTGAALVLPARQLAALRFGAASAADGGFARAVAEPPRTDDLLFAAGRSSGEITRLSVEFVGLADGLLKVRFRGRDQELPLSRVHGIVFGAERGAAPPPLPRPTVTVTLADGAAFSGKLTGWDAERIALRLAEGAELALPATAVAAIDVRSDRVAWLSALTPAEVRQTPAFDRLTPWLADRTPVGAGLVLGGVTHDRGLCLVPRTALSFDLEPGTFTRFEALVGIDDRAGPLGNAVVRVRLDGRLAWEHDALTAGMPPKAVRLELGDARRLTLETDFGSTFDLGDHCVFARPRLIADR